MIKNMTIKQLLNTDVIEEVSEAVDLLIEKMNDLNTIEDRKYFLGTFENKGELQLPPKSKCCGVKRDNNIIYKKEDDN